MGAKRQSRGSRAPLQFLSLIKRALERVHSKLVFASARVGVLTAEGFGLRSISDDDLAAAEIESVGCEHLKRSRQGLRLHPDPRRELPLGERNLGDGAGRAQIVQSQE